MKVLVFVKQIPDVHDIKFDPVTNRILREGVPLMMNSFDKKAVEEAIRLGEKYGAETIIASMGPPSATDVLNEGMKMGIQKGYLLTVANTTVELISTPFESNFNVDESILTIESE